MNFDFSFLSQLDLHLRKSKGKGDESFAINSSSWSLKANEEVFQNLPKFRNEAEQTRLHYWKVCRGRLNQALHISRSN